MTDRVNPTSPTRTSAATRWCGGDQVRKAFPDFTFDVNLLIEKDDLVVSNWTVKGNPQE